MRSAFVVAALVATGVACGSSFVEERPPPDAGEGRDAGGDDGGATPGVDAGDASDLVDGGVGSAVAGEVVFVDAGDAGRTTVILAPETFDAEGFHEKAPVGPRATDVTGAWTIRGVPAGTYVVLAGYEQDGFVLDPSSSPQKVVVSGVADETVSVPGPQRLVRALAVVTIQSKSLEPAITFVDAPGEDSYDVSVIDFQGKSVYRAAEPGASSNANVTFAIDAGLVVPLRYRFRVTAKNDGGAVTQTEDLAAIRTAAPDDT